jgi:hypothetical protein
MTPMPLFHFQRTFIIALAITLLLVAKVEAATADKRVAIVSADFSERAALFFVAKDQRFFEEQGVDADVVQVCSADAVLVSWLGSGNAFVEVMLTIRACERRGIKTALVTYEYGGKDGVDSPLLYYVPEADAVVSTGSRDRWIELPEAEKIIGPYEEIRVLSYPGAPSVPAHRAMTLDARDMIIGGVDNWGGGAWTCKAR